MMAPVSPDASTDPLVELIRRFDDDRRRRRSLRGARLLMAGLALALLAVWLLRPPARGGDENHATTAFPALSPAGLINGASYRQTDAALRDRLALRRYVAMAVGATARDHLGNSLNPRVLLGDGGIPFLTEDFTLPCQFPFDAARTDAGLRGLRAAAARSGRTITIAIAPDKSAVLRDRLGPRADALMACSDRVRAATEQTWGADPAAPVLTTWKPLQAAATRSADIFQTGDSHWTSAGSLIWAQALIHHLVVQGEAPRQLDGAPHAEPDGERPADGDLYRLMGISRPGTVPEWTVDRPEVNVRARSVPSPSGRGVAEFRAWPATADTPRPLIQGRTLVVDDSFFSRAEGQLAPYFRDLSVMHWADFLTALQDGTLPAFDRIVLETVQRGWPERAGWLTPGQPVHQSLAHLLSSPIEQG
jgi:acetyltransferase AlgX (SGNH hydrolase-like protein)